MPDRDHLVVGDLEKTLPDLQMTLPQPAALLHSDIGCGIREIDTTTAHLISRYISGFLAPGAWVTSDQPLQRDGLQEQSLPEDVSMKRYFIYRWND